MKVKNFLPQLITAGVSLIMLIVALFSSKVSVYSFPFYLFEKLGIYHGDTGYGVMDKSLSLNGTYELFVSLLKKISINSMFSFIIPITIFSVLLILALVIISKMASNTNYKWTAYLCAILLPLVFADFTNLAFFKTLYINPLVLILLLFVCATFLTIYKNNSVGIVGIITISILAIIYSCLGAVQAITAVILGLLITRLYKLSKNNTTKILAVILGLVVIVQSIAFTFSYKAFDYKQTLYNSVFYGVCKYDSVTALGLDKELDDFKEVYYGMKEDEDKYDLENNFYGKMSYKKLMKYYLTHPGNAVKIINKQASLAFYNDYDYGFTPYSSLKKNFIPMNLPIVLVIAIAYIVVAFAIAKKHSKLKPIVEFLSGAVIMWLLSLISTSLYFGNCDITSNMYTFNILFDILLLAGLIGGLRVVIHRQEEKKEEFGITHE